MTLRVGLVTSEFPPDFGGVETYAWQLASELGRRRHLKVTVYAPSKSADIMPPPGITIKPILKSCRGLDWPRLRDEPVDVWHALSAAHGWLAVEDRPVVVSVHGNDFLAPYPLTARPPFKLPGLAWLRPVLWRRLRPLSRRATQTMLGRALPRAAAILANSRYTAEALHKHHPACADKTHVAGVGVDPVFFDLARTPKNSAPQLLTVCRLSDQRKNVDLVLRALAGLQDQFEFEYVIAGDGPLRPALEQLTDSLGLRTRVRFAGPVSNTALHDLYARADLFVLAASVVPGSHEGFGIVYLEAAASGVPSLAARLAGAAEAVAEGRSGFFVEIPDVATIRTALTRYLSGAIRFEADACRDFARGFGWDRVADAAEVAYRQISMRN